MHIPRIIHQTYKTRELPERWRDTPSTWKRLHPEWTYVFWTDEDNRELIKRVDPEFLPSYDAYPYPIQRADAVRYYILKHYGGIYVDLDMKASKSFEPILQQLERNEKETGLFRSGNSILSHALLTNSIMISTQQAPFFDRVIILMKERAGDRPFLPHTAIYKTTGPCLVDDVLHTLPPELKTRQHVFPGFLQDCTVCAIHKGDCVTKNKFLTLVVGESWHNVDSTLINVFYCNSAEIALAAVCIAMGVYALRKRTA